MNFLRPFFLALLGIALVSPGAARANQGYCEMDPCCMNMSYDECGKFVGFADFLYWQAAQDGMEYAAVIPGGLISLVHKTGSGKSGPQIIGSAKVVEQKFDYIPGFRIGFGYQSPGNEWVTSFSWTRLEQTQTSSVSDAGFGVIPIAEPAAVLVDIIGESNGSGGFDGRLSDRAVSKWKFNFNAFDLKLGKVYCFSSCAYVHSYLGVRGASIRQTQDIVYEGFVIKKVPAIATTSKKCNFYGAGPLFGVDTKWMFAQDWSLVSGFSAGLIYGRFNSNVTPILEQLPAEFSVSLQANRKHRLRPMVDGNIGINWNTTFCDQYVFDVEVAYEAQYWWNQWQAPQSTLFGAVSNGDSPKGDLVLQGLTVRFGILY